MAEDDDDDSFGDFSFASFNPSINFYQQQFNQINGPKFPITTTTAVAAASNSNNDDDDEWGDFVETPLGSFASSNNSSKPFDPFNFFAPNPVSESQSESGKATRIESGPSGNQLEEEKKSQWVKLKGAIPLSIFGDVEEEEKEEDVERSGGSDLHDSNGKDLKINQKIDNISNGFKSNGYLGGSFNYDFVSSLYKQQINLKNESNLDANGVDLSKKDSILELNGLNLESGSVVKKSDSHSVMNLSNQMMKIEDGVNASSNGINSNLDALNLDFSGWNTGIDGLNSKSSLDMDMMKNMDDQNLLNKGENINARSNSNSTELGMKDTEISHFSVWNSNFDGFESKSDVMESNIWTSSVNANGMDTCLDFNDGNEELPGNENDEDDEWEFKDAYVESKFNEGTKKARSDVQETLEKNTYLSGLGNGTNKTTDLFTVTNGSNDLFSLANGLSSNSENIGFDIKSTTAADNNLASHTHLRGDQTSIEAMPYPHLAVGSAESDEDFGEFSAAFVGTDAMREADSKVHEIFEVNASSSGFTNASNGSIDLFSVPNGAIDLFAPSNGIVVDSNEVSIGFDTKPSIAAKDEAADGGYDVNAYLIGEQRDGEGLWDPHLVIQNDESDDYFGEFRVASEENALREQGELKTTDLSHSELATLREDSNVQEKEIKLDNHKGALPLSIFGEEELEIYGSLSTNDAVMLQSASSKGIDPSPNSAISISDLLSNLYSQAEQIPSVDSMKKPVVHGLDLSDSILVNAADDFDGSSWEFKDASFQSEAENGISLFANEDVHQRGSGKLKPLSYMDFYSKLKDELYFIAEGHLASLKETKTTAISGEDANLATLIEEIQGACKEVYLENGITKEDHLSNRTRREINLNDFLEILQEPKFYILETEYNLRRRLLLVELDFRATVELIEHVKTMLRILILGSLEEQLTYVSIWFKMISACARELHHGAHIWRHSLQKNIQCQILAKPQGKTFILALGEIYRVAVLLGASAKLYKAWILLSPAESSSIYSLLDQCHSSWSASGLEEAHANISDTTACEGCSSLASLNDSIKHIHDLDAVSLQNHVFVQQQSICRLSLLTPSVAPDMAMVIWDGEQCFLKLANLWANLVSSERPKLPPLLVHG